MEVFGITGTNGKTTTAYMLDEILCKCGFECAVIGTVEHRIGEKVYEAKNTTPGKELFRKYIREAELNGIGIIITEISSHALMQGRTDELPVKYAAFTNLTRDHMDYHKSMEDYYLAKRKLFDFKSLTSAIINIDNEYGFRLYGELRDNRHGPLTFSISLTDRTADYFADVKTGDFSGTKFSLSYKGQEKGHIKVFNPGTYNVYNALTAIGLAAQKTGLENACRAASELPGLEGAPGRFEIIDEGKEIYVCDYAHTPDALQNLLAAVREIKSNDKRTGSGRIITVFGCGGDRDKGKRAIMGEIAGRLSDYVIITSDNPRNESPEDIISQIEEGILSTGCEYKAETDRRKAIEAASLMAKAGDIVVVAGKGHETCQVCGESIKHFDDREVIREYL